MAEYPPYQSHGRYVSPNSKPNPYSQVRAKVPPSSGLLVPGVLGPEWCRGRCFSVQLGRSLDRWVNG